MSGEAERSQVTAYFDTSFFVALARASEAEAERAVERANAARIRIVVSPVHVFELARHAGDRDEVLLSRVRELTESPLLLGDATLAVLSASGKERAALRESLRECDARSTRARASATLAQQWAGQGPDLSDPRDAEVVRSLGVDVAEPLTRERVLAAPEIAEALAWIGLSPGDLATPESTGDLQAQVAEVFTTTVPSAVATQLESERSLDASVLATDNRVRGVVAESAPPQARNRLGNTLRDVQHMSWFLRHQREIGVLHIDGPQLRLVERSSAHPLSQFHATGRVFTARGLDAVAAVELFISDRAR